MFLRSHLFRVWIWIYSPFIILLPAAVFAQIVPEQQRTNTTVLTDDTGKNFTIQQGTLSSDQTNLFHHFERFDIPTEAIATFDLQGEEFSTVRNILNRVTKGNPSEINGLIEVLGGNNPNLYLLNPSGILFGSQASLNIPADFTASTASGLDFIGGTWLESSQTSDYSNLNSLPTAFTFDTADGIIINAADLAVAQNQNLNFLANSIINQGNLSAPAGSLVLAVIPGTNKVLLSQPGSLLQLEVKPAFEQNNAISALDFAALLTGEGIEIVDADFGISLVVKNGLLQTSTDIILPEETGLIASEGNLNLASGSLNIIGNKVAFLSGNVTANDINIRSVESFFSAPNTALNTSSGTIDITANQLNIYGDITTGVLVLEAGKGLEITTSPEANMWSISANKLDIEAGNGTITANLTNPFSRELNQARLGSDWLSQTLANGDGAIATKIGDLTLDSSLNIDGIAQGNLTLSAAQDLILNGKIFDSNNLNDQLSLNFSAQNNLEINQDLFTGGGDANFAAEDGDIFANADLNIGSGKAIFFDDVKITNITMQGIANSQIEFRDFVDGDSNLVLIADSVNFGQAVGSKVALSDLSLVANQLELNDNIFATGKISFSPQSASRDLTIGGTINDNRLNITNSDLSKLQDGFSQIQFSGQNIAIFNDLNFAQPLQLQAPTGSIQTNGFSLNAPEINISTSNNFNFSGVTANSIFLQTKGDITDTKALTIGDRLVLETDGNIILDNRLNDFNQVEIIKANNVKIQDANNLVFSSSNISGSLEASTTNFSTADLIEVGGNLNLSATQDITTKDIRAANDVVLDSQRGSITAENITSNNGRIDISALSTINSAALKSNQSIALNSRTSSVTTQSINSNTSSVQINAINDINASSIFAKNSVDLASNKSIFTGDITTAGNNINLVAGQTIKTENLNSFDSVAKIVGDITAQAGQAIATKNITANKSVKLATEADSITTQSITTIDGVVDLNSAKSIFSDDIKAANRDITLIADSTIKIGSLDSSSTARSAGNIIAEAGQAIATKNITANKSVELVTKADSITIQAITTVDGTVDVNSAKSIFSGNIKASANDITLLAGEIANTGNLDSSSTTQSAGNITVKAVQAIATGNIDSSSARNNAGDVSLDPIADIEVGYVNAEAKMGIGGDVEMTAGRHIRLTNTFKAASRDDASISTFGGVRSGEITLQHQGSAQQPFQVGNEQVNGSAGALVQGDITIPEGAKFSGKIDTEDIKEFRPEDFPQTIVINDAVPQINNFAADLFKDVQVEEIAITEEELTNVEQRFSNDYIERFNLKQQASRPTVEVGETLQNIQAEANIKPAVVYAFFRPAATTDKADENPEVQWQLKPQGRWKFQDNPMGNDTDELELVLVTANGKKIRKRIRGATRKEVVFLANRFFSHITNLRLQKAYYYSASELYKLLVKPLEAEMQAAGVTNLTYIMDSGLRVLPLAALYDQQDQQ
ncbi:MAG: filamentous hemagglutinin N-terminal domain-containing protein, partial [Limnothrix sp.]